MRKFLGYLFFFLGLIPGGYYFLAGMNLNAEVFGFRLVFVALASLFLGAAVASFFFRGSSEFVDEGDDEDDDDESSMHATERPYGGRYF